MQNKLIKQQNTLNETIKYLILGTLALNPLIFSNLTNEQFEFPKIIFVYLMLITICFIYLLNQTTLRPIESLDISKNNIVTNIIKCIRKLTITDKVIITYFIGTVASTVLSSHLYTSLWGYYTRFNLSLTSLFLYICFYFICKSVLTTKNFKIIIYKICIWSLPISIFTIIQRLQVITGIWNSNDTRVYSTLGQPNWLAAYLSMILLFTTYFLFIEKQKTNQNALVFVFVTAFSAIWFTYSISGLLGLCVGGILFALNNIKQIFNKKITKILILTSFFIAITNLGIFGQKLGDIFLDLQPKNQTQTVIEKNTNITKQEAINNVATVTTEAEYNITDTGSIRQNLTKGTLQMIFTNPKTFFVGTGIGTFAYNFAEFKPEGLNYSSEWNLVFNKPHNYYLEIWVETGIFALLAYLGIIFTIYWNAQKSPTKNNKQTTKLVLPALTTFFVINLFSWPTVSTSLLSWFLLAYAQKLKISAEDKT